MLNNRFFQSVIHDSRGVGARAVNFFQGGLKTRRECYYNKHTMSAAAKIATVYQLLCNDGKFYYGLTTMPNYNRRFYFHRKQSMNPLGAQYNFKVYEHIRSIGGWDAVQINIIERVPFTTPAEAAELEHKYISAHLGKPDCLNTNNAIRSASSNKTIEKIAIHRSQIAANNKRYKAARDVPVLCECGAKTTVGRQRQHLKSLKHRHAMETQ